DIDSGAVIHDWNPGRRFLIGSVRKSFSVALALDALGSDHIFHTPVHRQGSVDTSGVLAGDLILVASGDMAMGGRTHPDGSYAISDLDHNEANALENAVLTAPDPLAGFAALAAQVAAAGITRISGNVAIDDRLFEPFDFREQFQMRPIFVNNNVVDAIIDSQAAVDWRPKSAAFAVQSALVLGAAGSELELELDPELPGCIGAAGCVGTLRGSLPADFVPPLTGAFPLVRTFRIVEPSNYARTVFIEALARAGVAVDAAAVAPNPVQLLPARGSYVDATRVAELVSHPYKDHVKHVMKVSYNIGADLALMLFGLTQGANTLQGALAAEQQALTAQFGIPAGDMHFIDGSGGDDSAATGAAVTALLAQMSKRPSFADYLAAYPLLGVDGSLSFVNEFASDPSLAGAKGQVHGKTGTYVPLTAQGPVYRAQALAGYIFSKGGRRLAFALVVNEVGALTGVEDVLPVFQDQGTIAAILWKLH
ncbi:MAG TPA: D-alanyl-D-alanine carboxypeptidase, partial [Burkholderiaceae bacterium]|nr:D-alanyl-D-alanine carboxypeptidase [Burkholderiaceae bacterium]